MFVRTISAIPHSVTFPATRNAFLVVAFELNGEKQQIILCIILYKMDTRANEELTPSQGGHPSSGFSSSPPAQSRSPSQIWNDIPSVFESNSFCNLHIQYLQLNTYP